jgi:hypothetical protein
MAQTNARTSPSPGNGEHYAGAHVQSYFSTRTADRQPDWQQSKALADVAWTATRALLAGLGFHGATPTSTAMDRAGVDIVTNDGRKLSWRNRDRRYLRFADVTVRLSRPSGKPTECDKLAAGAVDFLLWTWTTSGGVIVDWLVLDAGKVAPMLSRPWPVLTMCDAQAACIPWAALAEAGAIVTASRGVRAAL